MYWGASGRPEFACEPPTKRSATRLPISLGEVPAGHLLRILSWPRHDGARTISATIDRSAPRRKFRIFSLLLAPFYKTTSFRELRPARAKYPLVYISKTHIIARLAAASRARRKFQCCGILGLLFLARSMTTKQQSTTTQIRNVPRRRWGIALLLGFGVLVNYFDRVNLSVSRDALQASFGISAVMF